MKESTGNTAVMISKRNRFAVVKASGENILKYLQGQITQDIQCLSAQQAVYTVMLNPQGKAVTDFYLLQTQEKSSWAEVMFLCQQEQATTLVERLRTFAMGYDLRMGLVSSWQIWSVQGSSADAFLEERNLPVPTQGKLDAAEKGGVFALRMPESLAGGVWLMGASIALEVNTDENEMERGRVLVGIPKLGVDWTVKLHPLNANLIERDGVSFDKGCYVGQEVTSRMQWRGGIKKRLYRVQVDEAVDLPCAIVTTGKIGEISSLVQDDEGQYIGIALLSIEIVDGDKLLKTESGLDVKILGVCDA